MRSLIPLAICVAFAACGSADSNSETLTLRDGTYTEDEYRSEIRTFLVGIDASAFCQSLNGLSNEEVSAALKAHNDDLGRTPKQEADPDDDRRATEIILEECDRIT